MICDNYLTLGITSDTYVASFWYHTTSDIHLTVDATSDISHLTFKVTLGATLSSHSFLTLGTTFDTYLPGKC